jgi:hypothetical protein
MKTRHHGGERHMYGIVQFFNSENVKFVFSYILAGTLKDILQFIIKFFDREYIIYYRILRRLRTLDFYVQHHLNLLYGENI